MNSARLYARRAILARGRATVALGLMLAVMAGGATAAAVGARRTETAYPRFVERYREFDVTVTTGGNPKTDRIFAQIAALPQVTATHRATLFASTVRTARGKQASFPDVFLLADASAPDPARIKIVDGRLPNARREDEALVNYAMAERLDVRPGDRITVSLQHLFESENTSPPIGVRIVGVSAGVGQFESANGAGFTTTFRLTPAFAGRWKDFAAKDEDSLAVLLRHGEADVAAFQRELDRRRIPTDGPAMPASSTTKGVQDLNRVASVALWLLCGILAVTTLAVFSQLIAREIRVSASEYPTLRALGLTRPQLFGIGMARALPVAAGGAILQVGLAILLSPLTPVGLARIAEPDPGFAVEPLALLAGGAGTLALILLLSSVPAWSSARAAGRPVEQPNDRGSPVADRLARAGMPVSMPLGIRMALERGSGDRSIPVRTAILGTMAAAAALTAALSFESSLNLLVNTPRLAGYAWDAGAIANAFSAEQQAAGLDRLERSIHERMPEARTWRGAVFAGVAVGGRDVGVVVSDGPPPSIMSGRAPRDDDEVALDPRTLRQAHARIGGSVSVTWIFGPDDKGAPRRMTVVGTFAVPRIAFQGSNPGQGVAMTPAAAAILNPRSGYADTVFVRFPPEADLDRQLAILRDATRADAFALVSRQQSTTVGNVARISALPLVLALTIGFLGAATLAHAVTTTIRRRRRELAVLKTLGLLGGQIRAVVAWQSTALTVAAVALGVPIGTAAGRWAWRVFATQLQVVPKPTISAITLAATVAGAIVLANLIAAFPGRAAARTAPAIVLRAE